MPLIAFQFCLLGWLTVVGWVWFLTACPVQATASSEVAVKSQSLKQSLGYQILHWTLFSEGVPAQHKTPEVRLYCMFLAQRWCEITCRYLSHSTPDSLWLPSPRLQVGARTPVSENHFGCNLILLFNTQRSSLLDGCWNMNWLVNLLLRAKLLFGAVNRCIFYIEYCI